VIREAVAAASAGEIVAAVLVLVGAAFCVIAGIGVLRMPDVFMRMHASTKAGTLGAGLIMVAAAVAFDTTGAAARALGAMAFILLTAPVAAHVIGRAAYLSSAPLSARTWIDERSGSPGGGTGEGIGADPGGATPEEDSKETVSGPATPPETTKRMAS
jgi:multicomponent Na+:H+ antiporter subunit G